jgi:hypothetical protein
MFNEKYFEIPNKIISIISILLCSIGIIGNILSMIICIRKRLFKTPTFVFMMFISLIDNLPLLTVDLYPFVLNYFEDKLSEINVEFCNKFLMITFWSSQSSIYLHFAILIDQFMCIKKTTWRMSSFDNKKAIYSALFIITFFLLFNIHLNFTVKSNYNSRSNETKVGACINSPIMITWNYVSKSKIQYHKIIIYKFQ